MLLHTIVSPMAVFPPKYSDIKYYKLKYGYASCENINGKNVIRSISSTNLSDYLDKNLSIGNTLNI